MIAAPIEEEELRCDTN